jgi:undecaprenyl-diphosphatase
LDYLKAVFLAVVEGITEFLPISSTGHLKLVDEFLDLGHGSDFAHAFIVIIQLPAIFSVVLYFWRDLWPFGDDGERRNRIIVQWFKIAFAFLPAALLGPLLNDAIEGVLSGVYVIAAALFVGGILLIVLERLPMKTRHETVRDIGFAVALGIGAFQCLAMIPGTSRSAATIIGAMLLGCSRAAAAEFSFFLAIPTMLGATAYTVLKSGAAFTPEQWGLLAIGSVVSFVTAYAVVAFLMTYIKKHDFSIFGWYRIALGIVVVAYFAWAGT